MTGSTSNQACLLPQCGLAFDNTALINYPFAILLFKQ